MFSIPQGSICLTIHVSIAATPYQSIYVNTCMVDSFGFTKLFVIITENHVDQLHYDFVCVV